MSNGTIEGFGYRVEARDAHFSSVSPIILQDGVLGPEWREVMFNKSETGHGIPCGYPDIHGDHGLLTYEGAMALAWAIIAKNRTRIIKCRLVQYKLVKTFTCDKVGLVDMPVIGGETSWDLKVIKPIPPEDVAK